MCQKSWETNNIKTLVSKLKLVQTNMGGPQKAIAVNVTPLRKDLTLLNIPTLLKTETVRLIDLKSFFHNFQEIKKFIR